MLHAGSMLFANLKHQKIETSHYKNRNDSPPPPTTVDPVNPQPYPSIYIQPPNCFLSNRPCLHVSRPTVFHTPPFSISLRQNNVPKHPTEMRSIYSDRKKQKLKEQKERFHFKKHGHDGLTPRSRANHEARVIKQYGRSTKQMSNKVNDRSSRWVKAMGDTLLRQTSGVQPVHRALVPFRSKFNPFESKVKHDKWHISVAKDNLLPRKHLRGGGLLDVEKSRILSESLSNSAVRLTQQKPVRLVQPKYRQPVRLAMLLCDR